MSQNAAAEPAAPATRPAAAGATIWPIRFP